MVPSIGPIMFAATRLLRQPRKSLADMAYKSWEQSPARDIKLPPMILLEDGLGSVTSGPDFGSGAIARNHMLSDAMRVVAPHGPTRVLELRRATLSGGSVYSGGGRYTLRQSAFSGALRPVRKHLAEATLVPSLAGCNYFGHWLLEDCAQQLLAEKLDGELIDIERPIYVQEPDYRDLLKLSKPTQHEHIDVSALQIIEDSGATTSKIERILQLKQRLWSRIPSNDKIPGVFVERGQTGSPRQLLNEESVINCVLSRGFQIVAPEKMAARDVASLLARSRIVMGVDGSHMFANPIAMYPGSCVLELHPANRFYPVQRVFLGPLGIHYSVLICENRDPVSFVANLGQLERLLDLCQRAADSDASNL
ncbi:MAG: hypothetical protein Aurels2KO_38160 [Aureliella sp.]